MGYALVSAGATAAGGAGGTLAPAFGQATGSGHLLVAWMFTNDSSATAPLGTSSPGWQIAAQGGAAFQWAAVAYKANCSPGETAPTFTSPGSSFSYSRLAEFSGGATSAPADQSGGNTSGGQAQTAACTAADTAAGDLIVFAAGWNGGTPGLTIGSTMTDSAGNSITPAADSNSGTGTGTYYDFTYGSAVGTGGGTDAATGTLSAFESGAAAIASFLPAGGQPPPPAQRYVYQMRMMP